MPETVVVFFANEEGRCPFLERLDEQFPKVQDKCFIRVERLAQLGHELRRPEADYLRNDIYELRVRDRHVNYRIRYFFHERRAVISHGLTKEGAVPPREIEHAIRNHETFVKNPARHTYSEDK